MQAGDPLQLLIYGDISGNRRKDGDVTALSVAEQLSASDAKEIKIRINSNGGEVSNAIAIYNALRRHTARKTVYVDGLAASAASLIAMAGDEILMLREAQMMIHNPWAGGVSGEASDMQRAAEYLELQEKTAAEIYARRSGLDAGRVREIMRAETWLSAEEAVALGFADRVIDAEASMSGNTIILGSMPRRRMSAQNERSNPMEITLVCPECGTEFTTTLPESADMKAAKLKITTCEATCPNCGASIDFEIDDGEQEDGEAASETDEEEEAVAEADEGEEETDEEPKDPAQAEAYKKGVASGIRQERARLKALDELPALGCETLIANAKYIKPRHAPALASEILKAVAKNQSSQLTKRKTAVAAAGGYKVKASAAPERGNTSRNVKAAAAIAKFANEGKGKK